MKTISQRESIATVLVNQRFMRNGSPPIVNALDLLPAHLKQQAMEDAQAVIDGLNASRVSLPNSHKPIKIDYEKIATDNGWFKCLDTQTDYYNICSPDSVVRWTGEDSDAGPKLAEIGEAMLREQFATLNGMQICFDGPQSELLAYEESLR